jgi:hypothetical protein
MKAQNAEANIQAYYGGLFPPQDALWATQPVTVMRKIPKHLQETEPGPFSLNFIV